MRAGSPTATHPIGTMAPGSRRMRRWTVACTLTSLPRPSTAPWKIAAPVATNTSSSRVAPVTWALGPIRQWPPDRTGMLGASPNHGVFHDDPVAPDPDGATGLTDEARAVQDPHARSNRDVAAKRRVGCHPRRRVDRWTLARMLDQHRLAISRLAASEFSCPRADRAVLYRKKCHKSPFRDIGAQMP